MLPTFVIIGAQKSASTFLQACLSDHPDIYIPSCETPFFESPDYEDGSIEGLQNIFKGRSEKSLGIKRPNYIGKVEVPTRIRKHLPNAKLIAVLRNPIDRAVSAYFHNIKYGFIPIINIEDGMRQLIEEPSFSSENIRSSEILEFGYYYKHLVKYDEYIKNSQLLVFLHEDIVSKPLESIQKAYEFLGVSQDFVPKSLNSRPKKVIYDPVRLRVLRYSNRFKYSYNKDKTRLYLKDMSLFGKIITGGVSAFDETIISRFRPNKKPQIGNMLKKMLYDLYADDIDSLEKYIKRDLSDWKLSA